MALVTCPDCSKQVSDAAPACPGCGRPMAAATVQTTKGSKFLDPMENARGCLRIVLVLVALAVAGIAVFVVCVGVGASSKKAAAQEGKSRVAEDQCRSLLSAITVWRALYHGADSCPTPENLQKAGLMESTFSLVDPWGNTFKIGCRDDYETCSTAGPDRIDGTSDDIHVKSAE